MKHQLLGLMFCFLLLLPFSLNQDLLPRLLSYQDPIDPTTITELDSPDTQGIFNNKTVDVPPVSDVVPSLVLGDSTAEKRVEVDLTTQRLYAFEGNNLIYSFTISSGTWDRTHPGTYTIWTKIKSQKMSGGSKELGTYFYLPNVPYIMFMYNDQHPKAMGYSLHGAYWHNNFGTPMSHGCINMKPEDAKTIYYWINPDLRGQTNINATEDNPGTKVIIYGHYDYPTSSKIVLPRNI